MQINGRAVRAEGGWDKDTRVDVGWDVAIRNRVKKLIKREIRIWNQDGRLERKEELTESQTIPWYKSTPKKPSVPTTLRKNDDTSQCREQGYRKEEVNTQ